MVYLKIMSYEMITLNVITMLAISKKRTRTTGYLFAAGAILFSLTLKGFFTFTESIHMC